MKQDEKEKSKNRNILIAAKAVLYVIVAIVLFFLSNILPSIMKNYGEVSGVFLNTILLTMRIVAAAIIAYGIKSLIRDIRNEK